VESLLVPLADRSYNVHFKRFDSFEMAALLARSLGKPSGVAVLVDEHVANISPRVKPFIDALASMLPRVNHFALPAGEAAKNLANVERTCEWLVSNGYDRSSVIIGMGGGATTDHAGFVASIYLRGVRVALCPTTLLAMVDASVGGKTGVDLKSGKNLVGAFHQPTVVIADLGFLDTLPRREVAAGMAEVVKAGLIGDAQLFERLDSTSDFWGNQELLSESIIAAVLVKIGVVSEDERETGRRAILNFGHTFGHAVESASNYELLHGEAVSLGMIAALALGEQRGITKPGLRLRLGRLLSRLGLPVNIEKYLSNDALSRVAADKKRNSNFVRFVHVPYPGQAVLEEITLDDLRLNIHSALSAKD
jgi:3-dehydroquinate synthase